MGTGIMIWNVLYVVALHQLVMLQEKNMPTSTVLIVEQRWMERSKSMSDCFIQIMELIEVGKRITCEHCPWECKEQEHDNTTKA